MANGEYLVSRAFVVIDISLVAGATLVGFALAYYLRQYWRRSRV